MTCWTPCSPLGGGDDLAALLALTDQVGALLQTPDGASLLIAHKRASNILRIETAKDGPHDGTPEPALFRLPEEDALHRQLARVDSPSNPACTRRKRLPQPCRRSLLCGHLWMRSSTA